jgi:hypothetical protein
VGVEHRRARRRWLVVALAASAAVVVAAVVIRATVLRDQARPVAVDAARERFRAEAAPTTTPDIATTTVTTGTTAVVTSDVPDEPQVLSLVAPGVYRYGTTGSESIDVLGGATHTYPAETTITVTAEGCGVLLRWDALVERRDEWRLCSTAAGVELQPVALQYHEFFGQRDAEDLVCDRAVLLVPVATPTTPTTADHVGPVTQSCMLADDPWLATWEVLETGRRTVDGASVDVRHVRMTVDDDDEHWEHTVVDWYLAGDGLPVEVVGTKESRSPSPIGAVVYRETYRLMLVSTVPLT